MYATRRLSIYRSEKCPEDDIWVHVERGGEPVIGYSPDRISAVEEDVMYWHKANHIHQWFVENVQGADDDCGRYLVDWDKLEELLSRCKKVIRASKLAKGKEYQGALQNENHRDDQDLWDDAEVIQDASVAKNLLPTSAGFFFGSTDYDRDYLDDVKVTAQWVERMLADRKAGVPGDIYYSSSW